MSVGPAPGTFDGGRREVVSVLASLGSRKECPVFDHAPVRQGNITAVKRNHEAFRAKAPMGGLAAKIPVHVVTDPKVALLGASLVATRVLASR